ncbi:hypothetical protein LINPERPRIM_LOCUS28868 [Linum perenne]
MYPHYEYFNPAMQQQYPPHSMPTPPADTRPDDMVESDGMSNDESRKKWTIEDDKLLASSYLIISTDSVKAEPPCRNDVPTIGISLWPTCYSAKKIVDRR